MVSHDFKVVQDFVHPSFEGIHFLRFIPNTWAVVIPHRASQSFGVLIPVASRVTPGVSPKSSLPPFPRGERLQLHLDVGQRPGSKLSCNTPCLVLSQEGVCVSFWLIERQQNNRKTQQETSNKGYQLHKKTHPCPTSFCLVCESSKFPQKSKPKDLTQQSSNGSPG